MYRNYRKHGLPAPDRRTLPHPAPQQPGSWKFTDWAAI